MGMAGDDAPSFDTEVDGAFVVLGPAPPTSGRRLPAARRGRASGRAGPGLYEMTPDRHPVTRPCDGSLVSADRRGVQRARVPARARGRQADGRDQPRGWSRRWTSPRWRSSASGWGPPRRGGARGLSAGSGEGLVELAPGTSTAPIEGKGEPMAILQVETPRPPDEPEPMPPSPPTVPKPEEPEPAGTREETMS